ncbi:hypothetical protein PFISCL1PPCAC_15158, partial [Pristionchus fissidentatus]
SFGLSGEDEYASTAELIVSPSSAFSCKSIRHVNEVQQLQKSLLVDRERRSRQFDGKLAEHKAKFSPKVRDVNILEKSMNSVTIDPTTLPKASPTVSKPKLISSTPLPVSKTNFSFSNPSTSILSPIPNIENIPRFRDSLATPLFKGTDASKTARTETKEVPTAKKIDDGLAKTKLDSVKEERGEESKPTSLLIDDRRPTSTSVTPTSTRPSSPSENPVVEGRVEKENTSPPPSEWSLSNVYYSEEMMELKSFLDDARMFESRSGITTRSLIKRSILEKVTVTSKRHATTEEIYSTSDFFSRLLSMEEVQGFNKETFRLREKMSVHYAMTLVVEHYLGLLERDSSLADTICSVLYSVSTHCRSFAIFLSTSLLSKSAFLDMDKSKCSDVVSGMTTDSQSMQDVMAREKAVCSLFYGLHSSSSKKPIKDSPFPLSSIWRIVGCTLNRAPILLATPFSLTELLKACGTELQSRYGIQMEKMTSLIQDKLIPQLEQDLEKNQESRKAGNAAFISALRSTIDLLIIS